MVIPVGCRERAEVPSKVRRLGAEEQQAHQCGSPAGANMPRPKEQREIKRRGRQPDPASPTGLQPVEDQRAAAIIILLSEQGPKRQHLSVLDHDVRCVNDPPARSHPARGKVAILRTHRKVAGIESAQLAKPLGRNAKIVADGERGLVGRSIGPIEQVVYQLLAGIGIRIRLPRVHRAPRDQTMTGTLEMLFIARQPVRAKEAIIVRKDQVMAARLAGSGIFRAATSGVRHAEPSQRQAVPQGKHHLIQRLLVPVFYNDEFPAVSGIALRGQRRKTPPEAFFPVARGNDHREEWLPGAHESFRLSICVPDLSL